VQGRGNIKNPSYAHIVGNGEYSYDDAGKITGIKTPSNAHTLDWSGNAWFAGDVKIGGTGYSDATAKTLATKNDIESLETKIGNLSNVMNFLGTTATGIEDGVTTIIEKPTGITEETYTAVTGDVVIDSQGKECVFDGNYWRHVGDASYAATAGHATTAEYTNNISFKYDNGILYIEYKSIS
jgi:hypothetical protein